mmetsp:Transcript_1885/g.5494  ORF Transcript_1885/g.5494 Transcript_1885/m.5494 type:complete len:313 (-) Transcript_1885:20-958(-)
MGKKSKRLGKASGSGASKPKQGPGKARRERAVAARELEVEIQALADRLEEELHDVDVFAQLEKLDECPICFVPVDRRGDECLTMMCCCKLVCGSCLEACDKANEKRGITTCPMCRTDIDRNAQTRKENAEQLEKRVDTNDAQAMVFLAALYKETGGGIQKDEVAEARLYLRATELDPRHMIHLIWCCTNGVAVKKNSKLAMQLATAAAKKGSRTAHYFIGHLLLEPAADLTINVDALLELVQVDDLLRAREHLAYGARGGDFDCMRMLKWMYRMGVLIYSFDEIKKEYYEAKRVRWSEEREAFLEKPLEDWK